MNRIEEIWDEYYAKGDFSGMQNAFDSLDRSTLTEKEKELMYSARALIANQLNRWKDVKQLLEEGITAFPESGLLNYMLGTEYELRGNGEGMAACFSKAAIQDTGPKGMLHISRSLYLHGCLDQAIASVEKVFALYNQIGILDDHYLFMQGIPSFGTAFGCFATYHLARGSEDILPETLDWAEEQFSDYNFLPVKVLVAGYLDNNWQPLIDSLQEGKRNRDISSMDGWERLRLAIYSVKQNKSWENASALYEQVEIGLTQDDFPWLSDVLLYARAEACAHTGDERRERELIHQFLSEKPQLLEPDIAFELALVEYQEQVKVKFELPLPERVPLFPVQPEL